MRIGLQRRRLLSQSGSKAQVLSVDSSMAYLLFAIFLLYMSNYIVNLSSPFSSYMNSEELYKRAESVSSKFSANTISIDYLDNICSSEYPGIVSTRAGYAVESITLPGYDAVINSSNKGLHFRRDNNELLILSNTNTEASFELVIITAGEVSFSAYNTEPVDSFNISRTVNDVSVSVFSNTAGDDEDIFNLTVSEEALVFLNYEDLTHVFIGTSPFTYYCGEIRGLSDKTHFSSYAVLNNAGIIASYSVEAWWN